MPVSNCKAIMFCFTSNRDWGKQNKKIHFFVKLSMIRHQPTTGKYQYGDLNQNGGKLCQAQFKLGIARPYCDYLSATFFLGSWSHFSVNTELNIFVCDISTLQHQHFENIYLQLIIPCLQWHLKDAMLSNWCIMKENVHFVNSFLIPTFK